MQQYETGTWPQPVRRALKDGSSLPSAFWTCTTVRCIITAVVPGTRYRVPDTWMVFTVRRLIIELLTDISLPERARLVHP